MADARRGVRERGKSDPIDALAIARAALREGIDTLPTARLASVELEIRLQRLHASRLRSVVGAVSATGGSAKSVRSSCGLVRSKARQPVDCKSRSSAGDRSH